MKWLKHDANAHRDAKLKKLQIRYGMVGFGLYWFLVELIADKVDQFNLNFVLEEDAEIIAHETGLHQEDVESMVYYMVELNLFEESNGVITCLKLAKRLDQSMTSNPTMRKLINQIRENHGGVMTASAMSHEAISADNTSIEKKRKNNRSKSFVKPSIEQISKYCSERKNGLDAEKIYDHYEANGWMRGKTKISDWKACVRTWEKNKSQSSNIDDAYSRYEK